MAATPIVMHPPSQPVTTTRRAAAAPSERARTTAAAVPQAFFHDLVRSMRNGVIAITRDGRLTLVNDEAYRVLGLTPHPDDLGRQYADVLRECGDVVRVLDASFELGQLPSRAELRLRSTGRVIGYTVNHVRDARGCVTGASFFFKDLTRIEQLEERERLRDRLAALGEMAAAIAHEVKNPLAGIEVMAGLLKRRLPQDADAHGLLNDIIQEAKTANSIVVEVLEFVRPIRLQLDRVSMAALVDEALHLAETCAARGTVEVEVDRGEHVPVVEGDAQQLRQVVTNLLTNAFEALAGRGRVRVCVGWKAGEVADPIEGCTTPATVRLEVSDDGPGIPSEIRDRIFSPFFTTKPRGSGLGLAIVRKIVDAHQGRIDVAQCSPCGTTFRVTLPVTPEVESA